MQNVQNDTIISIMYSGGIYSVEISFRPIYLPPLMFANELPTPHNVVTVQILRGHSHDLLGPTAQVQ